MEDLDEETINAILQNIEIEEENKYGEFKVLETQQTRNFRTIDVDKFSSNSKPIFAKWLLLLFQCKKKFRTE